MDLEEGEIADEEVGEIVEEILEQTTNFYESNYCD